MSWRPEDVGWCHHCETFQRFRDAQWLASPFAGAVEGQPEGPGPVPCCAVCGADEPWGLGVWGPPGHDFSAYASEAEQLWSGYPDGRSG